MADALSRRYALITSFNACVLGFGLIKHFYEDDLNFEIIFRDCLSHEGTTSVQHHYINDRFLFKSSLLCIPRCSMCTLLVLESHCGGLMGHFGVDKTLGILKEHFVWPNMRYDVEGYCASCVTCHKAKSTNQP